MVGGGLLATLRALGETCNFTPAQMEGPYYPQGDLNRDYDLTTLKPGAAPAVGEIVHIEGQVLDKDCRPIPNALVEIWQACYSGKYNHSDDTNNLTLDPNFQYWGRALTAEDGSYLFVTIVPGHYPVGPGQFRPPHIHYKAHAKGYFSLTTQMYFDPKSYDDKDLAVLVDKLNKAENVDPRLIVDFRRSAVAPKRGRFDLTLRKH